MSQTRGRKRGGVGAATSVPFSNSWHLHMSRSVDSGYCLWTEVTPKEGREGIVSTPVAVFEQLSSVLWTCCRLVGVCWGWTAEATPQLKRCHQPWVGRDLLDFPCVTTFLGAILPGIPAWTWFLLISSEGHWSLACRLPVKHLKHIVSMTEVLCVSERWRERCLGWYNTGYLSTALPEPAHGWGSKLEMSGWLWRHWWPPLCISLFPAPNGPCITGQSLRIWHCTGNSITSCWMEKSPLGAHPMS